jgi:hypothetical protein
MSGGHADIADVDPSAGGYVAEECEDRDARALAVAMKPAW